MLYGAIMRLRNFLFHTGVLSAYRSKAKVVSVGNISTGGTGKTPVSLYLLTYFIKKTHQKAGYLSRGYGRKSQGLQRVETDGNSQLFGDEALMVANRFPEIPVLVSESRQSGLELLETEVEIVVLDDAFQHRKVARDLDLVVIDANRLPLGDLILPAGNLREPLSGILRADFLIINKVNDSQKIPELKKQLVKFQKPMAFCTPKLTQWQYFDQDLPHQLSELQHKPVIAFSGIGNPQAFTETLKQAGIDITDHHIFKDHHSYQKADFMSMMKSQSFQQNPPFCLITTEKDYFRLKNQSWLPEILNIPLAYVQMELHWWEGEDSLQKMLPN